MVSELLSSIETPLKLEAQMKSIGPEPEPEDERDDGKEKSKMFVSVFKTEETEK